ncbi:MAG TPA: alpha/beta hydrolase [Parapedobacter sp.]|uniref:alpha/beta fold hydrolase n=1 Tax=Parapedobacter sp. TaxID=1958893 RepID=UPI002CF7BF10|nr:alpha/beta hydrolase [Parapedobacter sp.]HWK57733.1 alpha/beta hydrolase [Parapedobacter sp.]
MQVNATNDGFLSSHDGTAIAYQRSGHGPPLILVGGGLDDGGEHAPLAAALSNAFTVYNYARRGRGPSGNTLPYGVRREIEDIEALIGACGGSANLFGASSGGTLALLAASAGLAVTKLAVYEIPYINDEYMVHAWKDYTAGLHRLLENGQPEAALELFMRFAGSDDGTIQEAKQSGYWQPLIRLAPTLAYDAACLDALGPFALSSIKHHVLILTGSDQDFFRRSAEQMTTLLPRATGMVVDGTSHVPDPGKLAPILIDFFG